MSVKVGLSCKLYRNTGTYGTPVWAELTLARDVDLAIDKGAADATSRASGGWKQEIGTLKTASIEAELIYDIADTGIAALQTAFLADTDVEIAMLDGASGTAGSKGFRMLCEIMKWNISQKLEGVQTVSVTFKPTYSSNAPAEMTTS